MATSASSLRAAEMASRATVDASRPAHVRRAAADVDSVLGDEAGVARGLVIGELRLAPSASGPPLEVGDELGEEGVPAVANAPTSRGLWSGGE